jgi:hypothetical protein
MNDVAALFSKAFDCLVFGFIMLDFFLDENCTKESRKQKETAQGYGPR